MSNGFEMCDSTYIGRSAYTEYSRIAGGKSLATGQTLPTWDELPDMIRYAWHGSTYKVVQAAHREGWEQGKREAVVIMCTSCNDEYVVSAASCDICLHHKAIAAMEYNEPTQ